MTIQLARPNLNGTDAPQAGPLGRITREEVEWMASVYARKGNVHGFRDPIDAIEAVLLAADFGMTLSKFLLDNHIIQGRPARKSTSIMANFQAAGGRVEWHRLDDLAADATFTHPQGGSFRCVWTVEMATRAGLPGRNPNWRIYPRAMLRSRCVSEGVRTVYPAALAGMYSKEEVDDIMAEEDDKHLPPPAPIPGSRSVREFGDQARQQSALPGGGAEAWMSWAKGRITAANDALSNEAKIAGIDASGVLLVRVYDEAVNHVVTAAIAAERLHGDEVANDTNGKRDRERARRACEGLWATDRAWVESEVERWIAGRLEVARATLGLTRPTADQAEPGYDQDDDDGLPFDEFEREQGRAD
jgi:hypothetical protein